MEFEWDTAKGAANIVKHGIDLNRARTIWDRPIVDPFDRREVAGEERLLALGIIEDDEIIITIVYTWREDARRLISARRARRDERAYYQETFGRGR